MLIFGIVFFGANYQCGAKDSKFDFATRPELTNSFAKETGFGFDFGTSVTNVTGGGVASAARSQQKPCRISAGR